MSLSFGAHEAQCLRGENKRNWTQFGRLAEKNFLTLKKWFASDYVRNEAPTVVDLFEQFAGDFGSHLGMSKNKSNNSWPWEFSTSIEFKLEILEAKG